MKRALPLAVLGLALTGVASAHPTHGPYPGPTQPKAEAPAPTPIPETYAGVVAALGDQLATAEAALTELKIADFHGACVQLRELAQAVPAKTAELPEEGRLKAATTSTKLEEKVVMAMSRARAGDLEGAKADLAVVKGEVEALGELAW